MEKLTQQEFQRRFEYDAISDLLGTGGFSKVFKAYDNEEQRLVAIKVAAVNSGQEKFRLKKEVDLIKKYKHPNIARYEDCYTFKNLAGEFDYGILQYYPLGNLLQLLERETLPDAEKQNILKGILTGLHVLHDNGIIHRDLKPQNILMGKEGGNYIPKITDFGISRELDKEESKIDTTSAAGTPSYASPEQLKASASIHKNTDLWSFGVIAFRLFTGELPFKKDDSASASALESILKQINRGSLPESIRSVPEPWQALIRQCLISDPRKRLKQCSDCEKILSDFEQEKLFESYCQQAKTFYDQKDYKAANSFFEKALELFPDNKVCKKGKRNCEQKIEELRKKQKHGQEESEGTIAGPRPGEKPKNTIIYKKWWIITPALFVLSIMLSILFFKFTGLVDPGEKIEENSPQLVVQLVSDTIPVSPVDTVITITKPEWQMKYDQGYAEAIRLFNNGKYESAMPKLKELLSLIPSTDNSGKRSILNNKIAECDRLRKEYKNETLKRANTAFESGNYATAYNLYKEVKGLDASDNAGYYNFLSKAKELIGILGECDSFTKGLLYYAQGLKNTTEVNSLLSNCK